MSQPPPAPRLLILEDDMDLREQWRHEAERSGLLCSPVDTVEAAEQVIRRSHVDAAIVDMFLPSSAPDAPAEGGLTFLHHLRNPSMAGLPSWTVSMPVISVTGSNPGVNALSYARSAGANLTLRKPVPPGHLIREVRRLIATRPDS